MDVLVSVMEGLCFKIDASAEERTQCVRKVRERKMGYLFENMEKMSLQEERRKTEEARKEAEAARQEVETVRQEASAAVKKAEAETAAMLKRAEAAEALVRQLLEKSQSGSKP